jgi:MFS family permease
MQVIKGLKREFSFVRGNVLVLMVSWVLMHFAGPIPDTYYSLFVLELGATPSILGLIGFASFLSLALVQFPGGYLADRYGRRKLVVIMTFGVGLANIFYALAPSWHFILIGAVISNLCLIYQAALWAIMADSLPQEKRGMGFSVMQVVNVVSIVSPLIAGFLYTSYGLVQGMRIAYLIVMVFYLLAAIIRIRLRETIEVKANNVSFTDVIRNYPIAIKESLLIWRFIPKAMLYLFLISTVAGFFSNMCSPYYVVYATNILKIEKLQWALLITLQSAIIFGSLLPIGKFIDVIGRKKPLVIAPLIGALNMLLFIYGDFLRLTAFFILAGISNDMYSVSIHGS